MGKNFFRLLQIYFFGFLVYTLIFISFFHIPFFSFEKVFFYRGIMFLFLTSFIFLLLLFLANKLWRKINFFIGFSLLVFCFSINLSIFIVFPVTFERSLTMFLLQEIKKNEGINKNLLNRKLVDDYFLKNNALEKRILEQKEIGFIVIKDNKIYLSDRAKKFLFFSQFIKLFYGIK